ncbi:MAG: hypothetical protein IT256_07530 [Chitinophagaceae bacterium]|nr:hypothetical protein [Chitinophagaceae bacterium]
MKNLFTFLFLLLMIFSAQISDAQMVKRTKALPSEPAPKAVLIEIFTGYKRLERTQDKLTKPELEMALQKATQKMILDFEDNFKYCPVYYFYDSNIVAIQNGEIQQYIMDKNGKSIDNPVVQDGDTTVLLLYYGVLIPDESTPFDMHVSKKMLIALDYKGDVLPFPLPRTPGPATFRNIKSKKFNVFYRYSNTRTDTHYRACALRYSQLLKSFYGKQKK